MKSQSVFINGRFLTQKITGVQRYALEITNAFDTFITSNPEQFRNIKIVLLIPGSEIEETHYSSIEKRNTKFLHGHLWEQIVLPIISNNNLLINLCNTGPVLKRKQIVFIHDAAVFAFPKIFKPYFTTIYKIIITAIGFLSKRIITVSNFSKEELVKFCKFPSDKIFVIHGAVDHMANIQSDSSTLTALGLRRNSYVFTVGSNHSLKNFQIINQLQKLLSDSDVELTIAIAGGESKKIFHTPDLVNSKEVQLLGYVTDEQLKSLYENALCFIFPSRYEGFGLPPLEAMYCGCPCVSSDAASLPEILEDSVLYFDPCSPNQLFDQLIFLLRNSQVQLQMKDESFVWAKKFSWENSAIRLWNEIRKFL